MNCYCFFPVFLEQNKKWSVVFLKKKGDKLIISSNQPVSFYNQPVCNHQKVRSTTLSRYVIRTSSKGRKKFCLVFFISDNQNDRNGLRS